MQTRRSKHNINTKFCWKISLLYSLYRMNWGLQKQNKKIIRYFYMRWWVKLSNGVDVIYFHVPCIHIAHTRYQYSSSHNIYKIYFTLRHSFNIYCMKRHWFLIRQGVCGARTRLSHCLSSPSLFPLPFPLSLCFIEMEKTNRTGWRRYSSKSMSHFCRESVTRYNISSEWVSSSRVFI